MSPTRAIPRRCAYCDTEFLARHCRPSTREKYDDKYQRCCSKSCALRLGKIERNPSSPWPRAQCRWCGKPVGPRLVYCSPQCRVAAGNRSHSTVIEYGHCVECGHLFVGMAGKRKRYCSERCAIRTAHRHRRHLERQAQREGERFTLRELADRDAWRCHLCGKDVPDRESRSRPLDPTIDHLIPLAEGGSHTLDNVALAHFRCNWQRGTTGPAQLRLAG